MTTENLQLGGGYAYQWRCASLLALCYLLPRVRPSRPELHELIMTFLGHVDDIYLEGVRDHVGVIDPAPLGIELPGKASSVPPGLEIGLEDISLRGQGHLLLLQVKTKEAEGTHWTLADPLLVKALYRFYSNPALEHDAPPIRFVFLSNRGFNGDLMRLKRGIADGGATGTSQADNLFRYLEEHAAGNGRRKRGQRNTLDRTRFDRMLARLTFIEFLPLDMLPLTLRDVAEAYGIDGEDTYRRLYTGISERSIQQGGARVTQDDLYEIVPALFAGRLVDYIRSQPGRAIADYLWATAADQPLPPLGATAQNILVKIGRLIGGDSTLLSSAEAFVLLVATCLPHLMYVFAGARTADESSRIHQLAAVLSQESAAPAGTERLLREFAVTIETVSEARNGFVLGERGYDDQRIRGERVRVRLLSALLHLATQLQLDQFVDPTPPSTLTLSDWTSKRTWLLQAYVQSVTIENRCIQLSITLPTDRHDEYRPWLVDVLDKKLQRQIAFYGDTILAPENIHVTYRPAIVHHGPVPRLDEDDWQRLKRELRLEQARATADQHDQQILDAQQLRDLLVYDRVRQAEQYVHERQFAEAAQLYAEIAQRLERAGAYVQARLYARRAASTYAEVDRQAEAEQYLFAAEVWLQNALSPHAAQEDLASAATLANMLGLPHLRIRLLLAQALFNFTVLRDEEVTQAFEEAHSLLPRVHDSVRHSALTHALTMREAMFASVQEQWSVARALLEVELAAIEQRPLEKQVEILGQLLLIATETGEWELADILYQRWNQGQLQAHPEHNGILMMHYAASLARRSDLQGASAMYDRALTQLDGNATLASIGIAYQNKQYMLGRHGPLISNDFSSQEARRIDLFNSRTHGDTRAYSHEGQALRALVAGDMNPVARHVRLAKLFYWRDGDWLGLEHIYRLIARWHEQEGDIAAALLAVVRACERKAAEKYCVTLRDTGTPAMLHQVVHTLLVVRPAPAEEVVAIRALAVLSDAIPPISITAVIDRLVTVLQGPETTLQHRYARQYAAEGLRQLVVQMDESRAHETVQLAFEQLVRDQGWEVKRELIHLITEIFARMQSEIADDFLASIIDQALILGSVDILRNAVDNLIFAAMPRLPQILRVRAGNYLQDHPNRLDSSAIRALVGEPPSRQEIVEAIEQILATIDPPHTDGDKASGERRFFGGTHAQQLINYNQHMPTSHYQRVVDTLMNVITSGRGELIEWVDAIKTVEELPEAAIKARADEIVFDLLQVEAGHIHPSGFSFGLGSVEDVRQASLRVLGKMYRFVGSDHQTQIQQRLVAAAREPSSKVRLGAAMGCATLDGGVVSQELLLAVFVLLHDAEPNVVASACSAASHLLARGLASILQPSYIDRLIGLAQDSRIVEIRVSVARGLGKITDTEVDDATRTQITNALAVLANDTSARVRRVARIPSSTSE